MLSNAATIYPPESRTGTAVSPSLEIGVPTVAINLPHLAATATTVSYESPQYAPLLPNWVLIGVLLFSLLSWWVLLIDVFSALASALIFPP
jgi:hypothetical protein